MKESEKKLEKKKEIMYEVRKNDGILGRNKERK